MRDDMRIDSPSQLRASRSGVGLSGGDPAVKPTSKNPYAFYGRNIVVITKPAAEMSICDKIIAFILSLFSSEKVQPTPIPVQEKQIRVLSPSGNSPVPVAPPTSDNIDVRPAAVKSDQKPTENSPVPVVAPPTPVPVQEKQIRVLSPSENSLVPVVQAVVKRLELAIAASPTVVQTSGTGPSSGEKAKKPRLVEIHSLVEILEHPEQIITSNTPPPAPAVVQTSDNLGQRLTQVLKAVVKSDQITGPSSGRRANKRRSVEIRSPIQIRKQVVMPETLRQEGTRNLPPPVKIPSEEEQMQEAPKISRLNENYFR